MDRKAKNEKGAAERVSLGGEDKGSLRRSVVVAARSAAEACPGLAGAWRDQLSGVKNSEREARG